MSTKEESSFAGVNNLGICRTTTQLKSKPVLSNADGFKSELPAITKDLRNN